MSDDSIEYVLLNKNLLKNRQEVKRKVYDKIYPKMIEKLHAMGIEVTQEGYGLFGTPCPRHHDNKYDAIVFDPLSKTKWTCTKTPKEPIKPFYEFNEKEKMLLDALRPSKDEINRMRTEMIVHHFLSNNYVITISQRSNQGQIQETKSITFVYDPALGHFTTWSEREIKKRLQTIHKSLYTDSNALSGILDPAIQEIEELTDRGNNMDIFDHNGRDVYYISTKTKDVKITRSTGAIELLDKDPINRPMLNALPYDFSKPAPEKPPEAYLGLLSLVPEAFRDTFKLELLSPLIYRPQHYIYVNYSYEPSTGKSETLGRMRDLYGDSVHFTEASRLGERFEKSAYITKSAILIDEYEGGGIGAKRQLKILTGSTTLTAEIKYGPTVNFKNQLSVIINTNILQFAGFELAFLRRLVIIPYYQSFDENRPISSVLPEWDFETKEQIMLYLVKRELPRYIMTKPKRYPIERLRKWIEKNNGIPDDGIKPFLAKHAYKKYDASNSYGVLKDLTEAYEVYVDWDCRNDFVPVTYGEFVKRIQKIYDKTGYYLINGNQLYLDKNLFRRVD